MWICRTKLLFHSWQRMQKSQGACRLTEKYFSVIFTSVFLCKLCKLQWRQESSSLAGFFRWHRWNTKILWMMGKRREKKKVISWHFEHQNAAPHSGQAEAAFRRSSAGWAVLKVDFMLTRPPLCGWKERLLPSAGLGCHSQSKLAAGPPFSLHCLLPERHNFVVSHSFSAANPLLGELSEVSFTGTGRKSLQARCGFSLQGLNGAPTSAGLFVHSF